VGARGRHRRVVAVASFAALLLLSAPAGAHAAASGLVAAYGFDEGAGTAVADQSGNANHGATTATSWSAAGRFGGALSFNGTSSYVSVPDSNSLDLTGAATLEAWVRPAALGTTAKSWRTVLFKHQSMGMKYALYANNGGSRPVAQLNVGGERNVAGTSQLALNAWTHLAATYDGAVMRMYVNGSQVATKAQTGAMTASTGALRIGGNSVWGEWFSGLIDDVRIYDRALAPAEVQSDMSTPVAPAGPPPDPAPPDTTPPTVSISAPAAGTTVGGSVAVTADAADDRSVAGVQFKLDGANLGAEDTSAPYAATWDTKAGANGPHTLAAVARDAAANHATSPDHAARVFNQVPSFSIVTLVAGLNEPTEMLFAPGGTIWIGERTGRIEVVRPGSTHVEPTPLMTIPNIYNATDERGLLGMTLDPEFATNGHFYVHYTHSTLRNRVSRFTATGGTADPASEVVLWENDQQSAVYHSGGTIAFGPDGYLYIGVGDRLDPLSAQRLTAFTGKVLRIGRDGQVPADNPFNDGAGPNKDAIWAYGLRNPFRFSFDPPTGRMHIGDVGQNDTEEIDLGARGANYGWPTCEGPCGRAGMTDPVHSYPHTSGAAVIGGFVYRGSQFPADYRGAYLYGDYVHGWFRRLTFDAAGSVSGDLALWPAGAGPAGDLGNPVSMVQGPEGALYYLDIGPFQEPNTGTLRRISNTTADQPPTAVASATPRTGTAPLAVTFSSAGSEDPEGRSVDYAWDFGDGSPTSTEPNPTHAYAANGMYAARLSVSDGVNTTVSEPQTITVGSPPQPVIDTPATGTTFRAGDTLTFAGGATDADDGALPASALTWKVTFLHEIHQHPASAAITGASGSYAVPTSGHAFTGDTRYEITLTATDSDGIRASTSVVVRPEEVDLTLRTDPPGGTVLVDGLTHETPYTFDTLVGFEHDIAAVSPQAIGGQRHRFVSWSDGGAEAHRITVPATARAYVATLQVDPTSPGLVGAYGFDEANGGTLYDRSGSGNDGTVSGAAWTGSGKHGGGLLFDGVNDMVTIPDAAALDFGNRFTLEAWVNPSLLGANWRTVVMKERPGGMLYSLYAFSKRTGFPLAQAHLGGAEQNTNGTAAPPVGAWTHLASVYDGSALRLYVNGVQAGTRAVTGTLVNSASPLRIGGNSLWNEYFNGQIDDVRLYNRALSQAEVQSDLAAPVG
jgi:glucose/arabinose dehydrogenase